MIFINAYSFRQGFDYGLEVGKQTCYNFSNITIH